VKRKDKKDYWYSNNQSSPLHGKQEKQKQTSRHYSDESQIVISCHPVPALPTYKQRGIQKKTGKTRKITRGGRTNNKRKKEKKKR